MMWFCLTYLVYSISCKDNLYLCGLILFSTASVFWASGRIKYMGSNAVTNLHFLYSPFFEFVSASYTRACWKWWIIVTSGWKVGCLYPDLLLKYSGFGETERTVLIFRNKCSTASKPFSSNAYFRDQIWVASGTLKGFLDHITALKNFSRWEKI